ncbi:MAG: DUF4825 domain-containing protein [Peptococcaceae bacterium]|jgi:hypothetical protein|nr:DUF4825 domain-containing protein [Peptococcaceae bacterium]
MKKFIKAPLLSTSFSENKNTAKKRLVNIFYVQTKKTGLLALALVLLLVSAGGGLIACHRDSDAADGADDAPSLAERLYPYKDTLVGDNSQVVNLLDELPLEGFTRGDVELSTDAPPYSLTVHYLTADRAAIRAEIDAIIMRDDLTKNGAILLSLIPNADVIICLDDAYGEITRSYYSRDNYSDYLGTDQINAEVIARAADGQESFEAFIRLIQELPPIEPIPDPEYAQAIRAVIGADRQVITNSGASFSFIVEEPAIFNGLDGQAFAQLREIDFQPYLGQRLTVRLFGVENYKTKERTSYVFVFYGEELLAYQDLLTAENDRLIAGVLLPLENGGGR